MERSWNSTPSASMLGEIKINGGFVMWAECKQSSVYSPESSVLSPRSKVQGPRSKVGHDCRKSILMRRVDAFNALVAIQGGQRTAAFSGRNWRIFARAWIDPGPVAPLNAARRPCQFLMRQPWRSSQTTLHNGGMEHDEWRFFAGKTNGDRLEALSYRSCPRGTQKTVTICQGECSPDSVLWQPCLMP